jgi:hypothetical protein
MNSRLDRPNHDGRGQTGLYTVNLDSAVYRKRLDRYKPLPEPSGKGANPPVQNPSAFLGLGWDMF